MKAVILAAGQGTRLMPYTAQQPKCMVPLAGKPLLHWQFDALRSCGITDLTLVGGYRAERLVAPGVPLYTNERYDATNMVTTLFCARKAMVPGQDLLICYGDLVYEPRVLAGALTCDAEVCLPADRSWRKYWEARMDDPLSDAETFVMDADGRVLELGKKPESFNQVQAQYMGLIKVRGDRVAELIAKYDAMDRNARYDGKDFDNMYMTSFIQHLIDSDWDVRACLVDNGWLEVDTAEELETYESMHNQGRLAEFCRLG